jgi:hypothetical protein
VSTEAGAIIGRGRKKKNKQKNFWSWGRWQALAAARGKQSFFASFCSQKEALSSLLR